MINTRREAKQADRLQKESGDFLKIQVTRDRLVSNRSYECLCNAVRWSLDYYAARHRLREERKTEVARPIESSDKPISRVRSLLYEARQDHPEDDTIASLEDEINGLSRTIDRERNADENARTLLGPLASAGIAALALEHENRKELRRGRNLMRTLRTIGIEREEPRILDVVKQIGEWIDRLDDTRRLFAPLLDQDDREAMEAFAASAAVKQIVENVQPLVPGLRFRRAIPDDIYLPAATFAEWNSLFQNVFINAANATMDRTRRRVRCIGGRTGRSAWIRVEDNGSGVELDGSDDLFNPFVRHVTISDERRALGLGGIGLGLTIVRMVANQRRARVRFVEPSDGWATAFQISWSSMK